MKFFATNVVEQPICQGVYGANSILTTTFNYKEAGNFRGNIIVAKSKGIWSHTQSNQS